MVWMDNITREDKLLKVKNCVVSVPVFLFDVTSVGSKKKLFDTDQHCSVVQLKTP
jgi:hypothetical protein